MQEIVQIWINLPKRAKGMEPNYIPLQKDEMPEVAGHDDLRISAGTPIAGGPKDRFKAPTPSLVCTARQLQMRR